MNETIERYESNVRSYCRKWPATFATSKGPFMYDEEGNRYIDFFDGAGTLNYGHNNPFIKQAVVDYLMSDGIIHALDMTTSAKVAFIETLQERILKPRGLDYKVAFPGPTGTNANELALKFARKATGRTEVWALMGAFHGMTLGALALTSDTYSRDGAGLPLVGTRHMPAPYTLPGLDALAYMEAVLADDHAGASKPAAIIVETTQAEGGIQVLPSDFLKGLRELCTRHGIVMIVDDIQVGCWRTGTFFSFERAGIKPDIVTLSKSLSGIGTPFALTLVAPEFDVLGPGEHNGTFRGNQLGMVAAKAAIDFSLDTDFASTLKSKSILVKELVQGIAAKHGLEWRGIGMIWAIEMNDGKLVLDTIHKLFDRGVICEACGRGDSALKLMPALITDEDVLREGFAAIDEVLGEVLGH
ncbi:MAG: diaminobutyrate--2-oxoglutarate transaminase [Coriobacteriales bacterium]|jgi:diaminobutyrate-2-oxoglutarate transaminase|nr:diaminobutyrate--2-oxoglutarate transaminase [Coriobacteriales bacterium]MDO5709615.1 diaminobutyrate--2-oxoglutarate transaminase [Coriobacteriales bacterium]